MEDFQLDIECAGNHKLPYSGYVDVQVGIPDVVEPISCLLLVTPDTRYGEQVPVILGTNVLCPWMETTDHKHGNRFQQTLNMPDSLYFTFRCLKLQSQMIKRSSGQLGVVKCAVAHKIVIPENSTLIVDGRLDKKYYSDGQLGITQPYQCVLCYSMFREQRNTMKLVIFSIIPSLPGSE